MNASEDVADITPSKKKLKQARLPFKLISEDVAMKTPDEASVRKRKPSTDNDDKLSKIGRREINKISTYSELVIISDDDSKDTDKLEQESCQVNPLVKLVDNVWKKKQKSKTLKQKKEVKQKSDNTKKLSGIPVHEDHRNKHVHTMETDKVSENKSGNKDKNVFINENLNKNTITEEFSIVNDNPTKDFNQQDKDYTNTIILDDDSMDVNKQERTDSDLEIIDKANRSSNEEPEAMPVTPKRIKTHKIDSSSPLSSKVDEHLNSDVSTQRQFKGISANSNQNIYSLEKTDCHLDIKDKANDEHTSNIIPVTPRQTKTDKLKSSISSKLDESTSSNASTPRQSKRNTTANSKEDSDSLNESTGPLTPKQLQRKQEFAKKRLEREREKQERDKKRQEEKEEKERTRKEKEEQKKKEKEEKEEQRKKEKEEKERQKELEKRLKEEKEERKRKEKEEKEEHKRKEKEAREEEKRKKLEAVEQEKQEQELKKKKAAKAFVNFFVPKQKVEEDIGNAPISKNSVLSSFTKKVDMRLAPIVRIQLDSDKRDELDKAVAAQDCDENKLYLKSLKECLIKPKSSDKTWPLDDKNDEDDDVMIIEDEPPPDGAAEMMAESDVREKLRPKLLKFHQNRRPPYWGTWRKKSACIKPRRPFGQDKEQLDYEVDSDEEWEEEEGESIDGSIAGSDDDPNEADEYEVDNEVFVPHGYLSDEEATMDEDDMLNLSPETQKARLKHLEDEFELEMKKPTEKLKTRLYGLIWENDEGGKPEQCIDALWDYFGKMSMIVKDTTPLLQPSNETEETDKKKIRKKKYQADGEENNTPKAKKKKVKESKKIIKPETKNSHPDPKNSQLGINAFLKKMTTP